MADLDEVTALFQIHQAAMAHGEQFKNIRDAAISRLRQIDAEHADAAKSATQEDEDAAA